MTDYGIKVSQPGYDVKTATPSQLVFSSKYQTLKIHSQGSGTVTHSGGRIATINHNLGYIPQFLVHLSLPSQATYYIAPINSPGLKGEVFAYADASNLYVEATDDFGWYYSYTAGEQNNYGREDGSGYYNGRFWLGEYSTYGEQKGALRFNSVAISRGATVLEANIVCTINGRLGSTTIPLDVWGIDEDNTSDFGSSPFGRSKTTATKSESVSGSIGAGEIWEFGITTMAQEIVNRGSWNSGNHMGFIMESKNNTPNSLIDSDYDDLGSSNYLKYRLNNNLADYKYTIFLGEIKYG